MGNEKMIRGEQKVNRREGTETNKEDSETFLGGGTAEGSGWGGWRDEESKG